MRDIHEKTGKLKVLLLESSPNWGGQEDRLVREAVWLTARGHRVLVACNEKAAIAERAAAAGLEVRTLSMRSAADPKGLIALWQLVVSEGPDLVHARSPKDAWLSFWLHLSGVPVVRSRHTTFPKRMPWRRSFIYRHGCRRLIASAGFIAEAMHCSLGVAQERIDIIGECVDTSEFSPGNGEAFRREFGIKKSAPLFGIVAMLRGEKGHDIFMRAAKIVTEKHPGARFVIVGSAASRERVKRQLEVMMREDFANRHEPPVIMTGFRSDVPQVMRAIDCLVVPSRREAQTIVIPQAFATGKPAIGSRVGGIPELVKHGVNGLIFEPEDHTALAIAMLDIASNPERATNMGKAARRFAEEELTVDRKMELLLASYRKCVEFP